MLPGVGMVENVLHHFAGDEPFAAGDLVHDIADDSAQGEKLGEQDLVAGAAVAGIGNRQQLIAAPLAEGFRLCLGERSETGEVFLVHADAYRLRTKVRTRR
jgi:hypothetical protein